MTGANSPSALPLGALQVDVSIFKNDRIGEQSVYNVFSFSVSPQTFNDLAKKPAGPSVELPLFKGSATFGTIFSMSPGLYNVLNCDLKVSVKENEVPTEKNPSRASIFATKASYISN